MLALLASDLHDISVTDFGDGMLEVRSVQMKGFFGDCLLEVRRRFFHEDGKNQLHEFLAL